MKPKNKTFRIVLMVIVLGLVGGLSFLCYQLKTELKLLTENYDQLESRNHLLDKKYKEEKARVGRLQRENLTLSGQMRQAKLNVAKAESERDQAIEEKGQWGKRLQVCVGDKKQLAGRIDLLEKDIERLRNDHLKTQALLKSEEGKNKKLRAEIQSMNRDIRQAHSDIKRYLNHNQRLAGIAKTLVGRVEKDEMGSSVLVKEPIIQLKRVELEKLLQEYLDKIDEEKVVQQ